MKSKYLDKSGNSGVASYSIGRDSITVYFKTGAVYLYDYSSATKASVEHMKELALNGEGLSTYISSVVKKRFAKKLR